ncbi:uncharacterized protein LOC131669881 [Phymastichus coffea]|uniref:uncharacterized protein LOC131669881 n=1 Tax=Phymastichus coffea TaxID=108790 RepID=UPI00273CEBEB|nr:uncharacterized protein LOC131669881 [Phymastichus coffea]
MSDSTLAKFLYYLFKCLGLAPLTYGPKKHFRSSKYGLLYSAVLMKCLIATNGYAIKVSFENNRVVQFDRIVDSSRDTIGTVCSILILITFCLQRERSVNLANKLKTLYELLIASEMYLLTKIFKEICILSFFAWLLLLIVPFISNMFRFELLLYSVGPYAADAIITGAMLQYSFVLRFVKQLFEIINNNIDRCCLLQSLQLKSTQISCARDVHFALYEFCEQLDKFYSVPMLLSVLYEFVDLVLCSYFTVKFLLFDRGPISSVVNEVRVNVILSFDYFYQSITQYLFLFLKQNKRTGKIIYKWMGNVNGKQITTKIVGSITTYIVILLQLQSKDRK